MLLPEPEAMRPLITAYARVRSTFGADLGERRLVLPNAEFFPDPIQPNTRGAQTLLHRMQSHAGMLDIPVRAQLEGEAVAGTGSCGPVCSTPPERSGARLVDDGEEWTITLAPEELRHPVALTTVLSRSLATVFLFETRRDEQPLPAPPEVTVDLLGVGLGFGALLMEGAYVYQKSCGGPSVTRLTKLGVAELSLCVALFCASTRKALRAASRELGTTQRAALGEARAWLNGNRALAQQIELAPKLVSDGTFELREPKHGLFSWFGRKDETDDAFPALPEVTNAARRREPRPPPDDDLKRLVEEALSSS